MKKLLLYFLPFFLVLVNCHHSESIQLKPFYKIIFLSNREASKRHFDIFMMNPDGSNQIDLTPNLKTVRTLSRPILSPDGHKVLFVAFDDAKISLELLDINNISVKRLEDVNYDVPQASFSRDGHKILFVKKIDGRRQIFSIGADGNDERHLSRYEYDESDPIFSPDSKKIAFVSRYSGVYHLCIMDLNGRNRRVIFEGYGRIKSPVFSPDGRMIAFCFYKSRISDIYMVSSTGGKAKNLTKDKYWDYSPIFSPDGSRIAFISHRRGFKYSDICIMDSKGHHFKNLTQGINDINRNPVFTPDARSIVFESIRFNNSEIYKVDIDGKNVRNLTRHAGWDQSPSL